MPETITTYKGKPASTLTREELIEAYTWAVLEIAKMRQWAQEDADMNRLLEEARQIAINDARRFFRLTA